jgi:hypothetical protein
MCFLLMVKKEVAGGLPRGSKGYYMGLNFGLFWQTDGYMASEFRKGQSDVPQTLQ